MKKIIYFLMMVLLAVVVNANSMTIANIDQCQGPVFIKLYSDTANNGFIGVENCVMKDNNLWRCECEKNIDITLNFNTTKTYSVKAVIEYYIEYKNQPLSNSRNPTTVDIENLASKRTIEKIIVLSDKKKLTFNLDKDTLFFIVGSLFIFIIAIFFGLWFKGRRYVVDSNSDFLNYRVKNNETFEEIFTKK